MHTILNMIIIFYLLARTRARARARSLSLSLSLSCLSMLIETHSTNHKSSNFFACFVKHAKKENNPPLAAYPRVRTASRSHTRYQKTSARPL